MPLYTKMDFLVSSDVVKLGVPKRLTLNLLRGIWIINCKAKQPEEPKNNF